MVAVICGLRWTGHLPPSMTVDETLSVRINGEERRAKRDQHCRADWRTGLDASASRSSATWRLSPLNLRRGRSSMVTSTIVHFVGGGEMAGKDPGPSPAAPSSRLIVGRGSIRALKKMRHGRASRARSSRSRCGGQCVRPQAAVTERSSTPRRSRISQAAGCFPAGDAMDAAAGMRGGRVGWSTGSAGRPRRSTRHDRNHSRHWCTARRVRGDGLLHRRPDNGQALRRCRRGRGDAAGRADRVGVGD